MKFRSEFAIKKNPFPIHHQQKLLLMGSCFTENIGQKLSTYKFNVVENPAGILFNPVSVAETIINCCHNKQVEESHLFYHLEAWHSWQHHSRFSGITAAEAVEKINTSTKSAHLFLQETNVLFITLGSAWVYELTEKATNPTLQKVAANNHKAPANWFKKRLLSPQEIIVLFEDVFALLWAKNPDLKIIFTISPVRHLREGAIENNRSKAALIQAVHQLTEQYEQLYYFPAYELVIDDLRDYRFYAEDLVHPNYYATQYVWEKWLESCTTPETQKLIERIGDIVVAANHKPFNPTSNAHQQFLLSYRQKIKALNSEYPFLNFENEIRHFEWQY